MASLAYVGGIQNKTIYEESTVTETISYTNYEEFFDVAFSASSSSSAFISAGDNNEFIITVKPRLSSSAYNTCVLTAVDDITVPFNLYCTAVFMNSTQYYIVKPDGTQSPIEPDNTTIAIDGMTNGEQITIKASTRANDTSTIIQSIQVQMDAQRTFTTRIPTGTQSVNVDKPVSSIYAGVTTTIPIYTETTTTEDVALSADTLTDFFSADNTGTTGTNVKGITWVNNSGDGLKLTFGNYGIHSSTSMTTFTAQKNLTNVVIKGLYYTETNYDKITLTVAGTTVLNAVSGTSSTLTQRWAGSLSKGQTIMLKFIKDSSASASNESSTYFTLSCDPYQKTTTTQIQTGTETKLVDKKIVKGYVGGPDGKARLFFGNNGLIASFNGNYTSEMINVDGVSYELCTLTSSGVLKLNKSANVWVCGGGSDGSSTSSAGGCGGNIGQTIIEDTSANYIVTIGASGTASTVETEDGTAVISAGGGTTEAGGCGRGGYKYATTSSASTEEYVPNGATDTHPFGLTQLDPCCAGAGSGSLKYKTSNRYKGGNGGSSGISPTSVTTLASGTKLTINDAALGGAKGGGNGGVAESNGSYLIQATSGTYYGAGGGGPWCTTNTYGTLQKNYGTPGSGYQGVVMLFEKLDAAAHQHIAGTEGHVTVSPTCNSTGTMVYYCTECGEVASTKSLPALGHYYESNGDGTKSCIRCGLTVSE